jgi:hypothetical protein
MSDHLREHVERVLDDCVKAAAYNRVNATKSTLW